MAAEKDRRANWKLENERRRHNFVPLIFELLKNFAQKDMLAEMFDDAQKAKKAKVEAEKAAKTAS
jgi:ubiquitin carboxyl-terminal hydrolase L5